MKLKLEVQDSVTILCVSEEMSAQHCAILKAGLTKLFQSGKKALLLDLTQVTNAHAEIAADLASLAALAPEMEASLQLACVFDGVSGALATRAEAVQYMKSTIYGLRATEAILSAKLRRLETEKSTLEADLMKSAPAEAEIKALRKQGASLKTSIRDFETQMETFLSTRIDPIKVGPMNAKQESLHKTLTAVLEQEGILPVT